MKYLGKQELRRLAAEAMTPPLWVRLGRHTARQLPRTVRLARARAAELRRLVAARGWRAGRDERSAAIVRAPPPPRRSTTSDAVACSV